MTVGSTLGKLTHDGRGKHLEAFTLNGSQIAARRPVDDAQGTKLNAVFRDQRRSGIKPDSGFTDYKCVVAKPRIARGVGHNHDTLPMHRMRAERCFSGRFPGIQPGPRRKPLSVALDEADQGNRRVTQIGGKICHRLQYRVALEPFEIESLKITKPFQLFVRLGRET
ncbi:hypothetical protein NRB_04900 [Novosphingobium sp. 11B]